MEKIKQSLPLQIFIALGLGIVAGLIFLALGLADFTTDYIKPFGTIFLNLLKFIVVPIVITSIVQGVVSLSDIKKVGTIGLRTIIYYFCTTAFAITIGHLFSLICSREHIKFCRLLTSHTRPLSLQALWTLLSTSSLATCSSQWLNHRCCRSSLSRSS